MKFVTSLFAAIVLAGAVWADTMNAPSGRVLVTLGGDVSKSNAPAFKPEAVNVAGFLGVESEKAFAFDDVMLAALEQHEITANLLDTGKDITYSGPRLSDLLSSVGADGKTALPMALDGYSAEITWDTIMQYQPILATTANGAPLAIGKLGPAMIVFPVIEDKEAYSEFSAMEVFAAFYIGIQ